MKKAWEIAREAAVKFGGSVKLYLSESLKLAWKQAKTGEENMKHTILLKTASYNEKRWGKPWLAVVTADEKGKAQYSFDGEYIGEAGYDGQLLMRAETGQIIAHGQRDGRGNGTMNTWYKVVGDIEKIVGEAQRNMEVSGLEKIDRVDAVNYLLGL